MDLDFLSDDDLLEDVGAFEAASGPGDAWNSVPLPVSLDLDAAASILMSDSAFIETVQMKQGCMKDIEAPPRARNTAPKQRAKLVDSREKNRLKQAAYRNKMKAQRTKLEARLKEVESKLLRCTASKERLASVKSTLLTRLKMATYALDSAASSPSESKAAGQVHNQPLPAGPQHTESGKLPGEASLIPAGITPVNGTTRACPRPLDSYSRSAAVSHEHILPHLPCRMQHQQSTPHGLPDISEFFPEPSSSSNISFADVSLVRDALECHQRLTLSEMSAVPAETAWYLLFPFEVRPGLRLSHSTSMGSPACHLSTSLAFWAVALECSFLKFLEDRLIATQPMQNARKHDVQELDQVLPSGRDPPHAHPQKRRPSVWESDAGTQNRPPKVPDAAVHVPSPQLQLLLQYGIMCGVNRRVRIAEAVRTVLRGILLRYRKQLPLEEWGPVCLQAMHAMQAQLECVQQCQAFKAASEKSKKNQSGDMDAGACMGGCMHTAGQQGEYRGKHPDPSHGNVSTGATSQTMDAEEEFALHPGLLQWATQQHAQHTAHAPTERQSPPAESEGKAPIVATTQEEPEKGEGGCKPALPDGATQSMHDSNDDSMPISVWGLPHEKIHYNELDDEGCRLSLAHIYAREERVEEVHALNANAEPACSACCAEANAAAVPFAVCGFGSCAGVGGEADKVLEGHGGKHLWEDWGHWRPSATWPADVGCELRGGSVQERGWEGGSGDASVGHSESPFDGQASLPGITGAALGKVAATFAPDSDSSQHAQHADGVAECPWRELQSVAIEMVKLMLSTLHEAYSECSTWDPCTGEDSAQASKPHTRSKKRQSNSTPSTTSCCEDKQDEGPAAGDPVEHATTHTCLVERARALNVTTALCANLLLRDAPVAYRHMTQPPMLAIPQMQPKQMRVFQYLRFSRTQKEHFAAMWRGWKRRRHALDQDFTAAVSLLTSALPSQPPPHPPYVAAHCLQACGNQISAAATGEPVATGASVPPREPTAAATCEPVSCSASQQQMVQREERFPGLRQASRCSGQAPLQTSTTSAASELGTDACVPEPKAQGLKSKARMSVVLKLLESSSNDACMHSSVVQRLIAGACAGPDTPHAGEEAEHGPGVRLLGSSGVGMAAAQVALAALRGVHETDDRMLRDYSALVLMTTWGLSEVELRRYWAALLEVQVPTVDMLLLFRTAAHDIAHEDLYASVQFMAL